LPYLEKLRELNIRNNNKIPNQTLGFLSLFTGLAELNIENCFFRGSLESLKNMSKLRRINVSNTNIEEGLEYLTTDCERFYCDRNGKNKSAKIVKGFGKYLKNDKDKSGAEYYDLVKWKEDKQNGIALIIPLERLYVIKSNMKRFHDKWGEKGGDDKDSKWWKIWEKIEIIWEKKGDDNLSSLQSPEEYGKYWYAVIPQWTSRAAAVGGGILAINDDYNQIGGAIGIASTFFETVFSRVKEDLYDAKEKKWEEFIRDTENLWNSCDELIGILEPIQISSSGNVNEAIKKLNDKIFSFLGGEKFDKNRDGKINYSEWKSMLKEKKRSQLTEELRKHWENNESETKGKRSELEDTVEIMRSLEEEIIKYRQYHHHWAREKGDEVDDQYSNTQPENTEKKTISEPSSNSKSRWQLFRENYFWGKKRENEKELPTREKLSLNNSERELQEWFTTLGLNSQETEFIYWLKTKKSKEMENFTDPQWVKERITVGELDLDGLREEYQDYQTEVKIEMEEKAEVIDLEDKNSFPTGRSSSFRKRTISAAQENKSTPETHELVDLSHQEEQLETRVQIPPKQK
jgi:hypothetical protein